MSIIIYSNEVAMSRKSRGAGGFLRSKRLSKHSPWGVGKGEKRMANRSGRGGKARQLRSGGHQRVR